MKSDLHDAYAAEYDHQAGEYGCHMAEVLFGLCYDAIQPLPIPASSRDWQPSVSGIICQSRAGDPRI